MAVEDEAAGKAAGGAAEAFTRKLGPFPIWVWGLGLALVYYLVKRRSGGAGGQQTDPAGNTGTIDPATGYVYGTPQDQAGLAAQNSTSTDTGGGTSGSTVGGQYPDNASWGRAAVNYLVSLGEDPTSANEAVQQFLSSQTLTPAQQGMINLAVQGLGAPPQLPGPTGTPPPPVNTPPSGTVYATNPPSGFIVRGKSGSTITVVWNRSTNATGYTVRYGRDTNASDGSVSTGSNTTTATIGGLSPGTLYYLTVQATPAKPGTGSASTQATTDYAGVGGPPVFQGPGVPPGGGGGGGASAGSYTVHSGDTLIGIANKLHLNWHTVYNANKAVIEDAAHAHGHNNSNNGALIFPGTVLHY